MAEKTSPKKPSLKDRFKRGQGVDSQRKLLEQLLQDVYDRRRRIYQINFVRGLFFGLGSVLGGTLLLALLIWLLNMAVGLAPFLSDFIREILDSLSQA